MSDGMLVHLEWWWNKTFSNDYAIAWFGHVSDGVFIESFSVVGTMGDWAFYQVDVLTDLPPDDTAAIALGGGYAPFSTNDSAYFDGVNAHPVADGIAESASTPRFRPNPATDELWIDLPDAPLAIAAIDASGRTHTPRNFTHQGRTLHVDLDAFPDGAYTLRIITSAGVHAVRFVKS